MATATACAVPDRPIALPDQLPDSALSYLKPDSLRTRRLDPGVVYRYVWSPVGPWAVHIVQADLGRRCDLEFGVLRAAAREAGEGGRERVSAMVERARRPVLAAVNADFFTAEGNAIGAEVSAGAVGVLRERPAFAWRLGSDPWIGTVDVDGDSVRVGWALSTTTGDESTELVGGFPELIDQGSWVGDLGVESRPGFAGARHPRTAVGYDSRRGWVWLVVVDGRQLPHSDGMTLPELAGFFDALGVDEALNLDGGGSTVMIVDGRPVSRPSDVTGERAVVNALALIQDPRGCALTAPR